MGLGISEAQQIVFLEAQVEKQGEILEELKAAMQAKDRELAAYKGALTPSSETKAAYIGEIEWREEYIDEDGEGHLETVVIPWTSMKEFMALIRGYAKATMEKKT